MSLIGTMGSGVSALRTFMKGLEVIGNNIANVNTTGYKSAQARYSDSFSNVLQRSTGGSSVTQIGTGVGLAGITTSFVQGSLATTGSPTDLGISGNGFFRVKNSADGTEFATRSGDFRFDSNGYLVTPLGFRVQGLAGSALTTLGDVKLATPPTGAQLRSVAIGRDGLVVENYSNNTSVTTGQILLQTYTDPTALVKEGGNLYTGMLAAGPVGATAGGIALKTDGTNAPRSNGLGSIEAGTLELSNVDLTEEFASLITTQRSFQAGSRLITVSDTILEDIVNLKQR